MKYIFTFFTQDWVPNASVTSQIFDNVQEILDYLNDNVEASTFSYDEATNTIIASSLDWHIYQTTLECVSSFTTDVEWMLKWVLWVVTEAVPWTDYVSPTGVETISNKTLTAPKFVNGWFIADANWNEMIIFNTAAIAVNELNITNAATWANPKVSVTWWDTNIWLDIETKGTWAVQIRGNATQGGEIRIFEITGSGSNYTWFKAPALAGNIVYVLPNADWASWDVLSTDWSGNLSWQAIVAWTVTTISVVSANWVSASITNPTSTPALTFTLWAITPSSVNWATIWANSITFSWSSSLTLSAWNALTLTTSWATNVTLPTSGTLATLAGTETLSNKRIVPRVTTITSSATPTINTDNCDCVTITALAVAITSMTTNLSGTPNNFDKLIFRIKDNGTARAITRWSSFEAKWIALPTTTVISKVLTVWFLYDSVTSKRWCVAVAQEA